MITWKKMKQLDELLDKKPTRRAVIDMAELRIRNLLAFSELQTYNDTAIFRYKNCSDNIRRYESFLKRSDRKDKRSQDKEHLRRFRDREALFKSVLEDSKMKSV